MTKKIVTQCSVDGCLKMVYCKGMCKRHYRNEWYKQQNRGECLVDECMQRVFTRKMCSMHYSLWRKYGSVDARQHAARHDSPALRFWKRVVLTANPEKCWVWKGGLVKGYGTFTLYGVIYKAHRYAWFLTHGYHSKMLIRHKCDNRKCVNPNHLEEGTNQDNMTDLVLRGTPGQREPLSFETYCEILRLLPQCSMAEIGRRVEKGRTVIRQIKQGIHWTNRIYGED